MIPTQTFWNSIPFFFCAAVFYARKVGAIIERIIAYARDAVGYRYTRKATATEERRRAYARDAIGDRYARNIAAIIKSTFIYFIILTVMVIC